MRKRHTGSAFLAWLLAMALCPLALLGSAPEPLLPGIDLIQIRQLPRDLPEVDLRQRRQESLIVDLRGLRGQVSESRALVAWLRLNAEAGAPTLILINPETDAQSLDLIRSAKLPTSLILGPCEMQATTDLTVNTTAAADGLVVRALESGMEPRKLLGLAQSKERWDEKTLMEQGRRDRERLGKVTETKTEAAKDGEPVDQTLLRAVHIHQGLEALGLLRKRTAKRETNAVEPL